MSCGGDCFIDTAPSYSGAGKVPYGMKSGRGYSPSSYFADPNALTAKEFEDQRSPLYSRRVAFDAPKYVGQEKAYAHIGQRTQVYAVPLAQMFNQVGMGSRLEMNLAYMHSLTAGSQDGRALDYSLLAAHRQGMEQLRSIMQGNVRVISGESVPVGHMKAYTSLKDGEERNYSPVQSSVQDQPVLQGPQSDAVAMRRSLLEDLIRKEKEALMN